MHCRQQQDGRVRNTRNNAEAIIRLRIDDAAICVTLRLRSVHEPNFDVKSTMSRHVPLSPNLLAGELVDSFPDDCSPRCHFVFQNAVTPSTNGELDARYEGHIHHGHRGSLITVVYRVRGTIFPVAADSSAARHARTASNDSRGVMISGGRRSWMQRTKYESSSRSAPAR